MGFDYTGADVQQNKAATVDFVAAIDQPLPPQLAGAGPFDFIVCTEVLEHVADWEMAFRNLRSLLAPGGRLLITCPHFYPLHETPHDYWRPTPLCAAILRRSARPANLEPAIGRRRARCARHSIGLRPTGAANRIAF